MMTLHINSISIFLWMQTVLITSEIIANLYTQQPRYTGKFLTSVNKKEFKAESVVACLAFCGPCCTCFGYQQSTKRCRVFDFCLDRDVSFTEGGWVYYTSPSGELFHIYYVRCFLIYIVDVLDCYWCEFDVFEIIEWNKCDPCFRILYFFESKKLESYMHFFSITAYYYICL